MCVCVCVCVHACVYVHVVDGGYVVSGGMSVHMCVLHAKGIALERNESAVLCGCVSGISLFHVDVCVRYFTVLCGCVRYFTVLCGCLCQVCGCLCQVLYCFVMDVCVRYFTILCGCLCHVFHRFVWMSVSGISLFCVDVCVRYFHCFVWMSVSGISLFCVDVCVRYFTVLCGCLCQVLFCMDVCVRYFTILCRCLCQVFHCFVWMSLSDILQFCVNVHVRYFTVLFCVAVCVRYFNWATAAPMVLCEMAFNKPLPEVRGAIVRVVLAVCCLVWGRMFSYLWHFALITVVIK